MKNEKSELVINTSCGRLVPERLKVSAVGSGPNWKYFVKSEFNISVEEFFDRSFVDRLEDGHYALNPWTTAEFRKSFGNPKMTLGYAWRMVKIETLPNKKRKLIFYKPVVKKPRQWSDWRRMVGSEEIY